MPERSAVMLCPSFILRLETEGGPDLPLDSLQNIAALDRAYQRLSRFLGRCDHPAGRAYAAASFLRAMPEGLIGEAFYREELTPIIVLAVDDPTFRAIDPDVFEVIRDAVPAHERPTTCTATINPPLPDPKGSGGGDTVTVHLPLFMETPSLPSRDDPDGIAIMATLRLRPRPAQPDRPLVVWGPHPHASRELRLRAFQEVGHDAQTAAMATVDAIIAAGAEAGMHLDSPGQDQHSDLGRTRAESRPGLARARTETYPGPRRSRVWSVPRLHRPKGWPNPAFDVDLLGLDGPVAGDSVGLAMAVAMAGTTLAARRAGRGVRPRHDLAWTGCVDATGLVGAVGSQSLRQKVRAAYFSGLAGIVVPAGQEIAARAAIPAGTNPGVGPCSDGRGWTPIPGGTNDFLVRGVGTVREALQDTDLCADWIVPRLRFSTPLGSRKTTIRRAAGITGVLLALGSLATIVASRSSTTGPACVAGPDAYSLQVTFRGGAPPRPLRESAPVAFAGLASGLPGDRGSIQRLITLTASTDGRPAVLSAYSLPGLRPVWKYTYRTSGLPSEPLSNLPDAIYSGKAAVIADLDSDGHSEIITAVSAHPYAPTVIHLFDGQRRPTGAVLHPGHVEDVVACDLDGDGRAEVAAAGYHSPTAGVDILVLRREDFAPTIPVARGSAGRPGAASGTPSGDAEQQPCLAHFVLPLLPRLRGEAGISAVGYEDGSLRALPREEGTASLQCVVNLQPSADRTPPRGACFVTVQVSPPGLISITRNANFFEDAQRWRRSRVTAIDLSSEELLEEWKSTLRISQRVDFEPGDDRRAPSRQAETEGE